jgi:4-diphosphocytidyl-2-C-methyl-D-erythritol kinase
MKLTIKAPAKVNWFLEIKGRRPDGYHEIETVMQAVDLFDEITVQESGALTLHCNIDLGDPEQNLAWRAAALLRDRHAPGRGARIDLTKRIPHGAGLGGGSSDAASTLVALNRLWDLSLESDRLRELAGEIGSDCAFFIEGGTALCSGRGEIVHPMQDIAGIELVILYPNEVCPTAAVYGDLGQVLTYEPASCYLFHVLPDRPTASQLVPLIMNRLEASALRVSAGLRHAWEATAQEDDIFVRFVSGSGSSIVFLMADQQSAARLVKSLTARQLGRAFSVKTLPRGAVWG